METDSDIRYPYVAGSFYPSDGDELRRTLSAYFSVTGRVTPADTVPRLLLVPHGAYHFSGPTAAWGYAQLPSERLPHTVIIAPSHRTWFNGMVTTGATAWRTPFGDVPVLSPRDDYVAVDDEAMDEEYGIEVQLPFLQYRYRDATVTPILTGWNVNPDVCADVLLSRFPDAVFVVSSDLSHYLPQEEAVVRDTQTVNAILTGDDGYLAETDNCACGSAAIRLLLSLASRLRLTGQLIKYDLSGRSLGDRSAVVGYAAIAFG